MQCLRRTLGDTKANAPIWLKQGQGITEASPKHTLQICWAFKSGVYKRKGKENTQKGNHTAFLMWPSLGNGHH
jgi:hypothetical protein